MRRLRQMRLWAAALFLTAMSCATQMDWALSPSLYSMSPADPRAASLATAPRLETPSLPRIDWPDAGLLGGRSFRGQETTPYLSTAGELAPPPARPTPAAAAATSPYKIETGKASWYGEHWSWKKTANGEEYNPYSYTAAHKTLPFDSLVRVKNLKNGREVFVRINNRGPFIKGRIIDLSPAAARAIDMYHDGVVNVEIQRVQ